MNKMQTQVAEFMRQFNQTVNDRITELKPGTAQLRNRLHFEEIRELAHGLHVQDIDEIVDGLVDALYVIFGTCAAVGVDIEPMFNYVHECNMKKVWTEEQLPQMPNGSVAKRLDNGYFVVTVNGKIIKPPGYVHPNLKPLIEAQR